MYTIWKNKSLNNNNIIIIIIIIINRLLMACARRHFKARHRPEAPECPRHFSQAI